MLASSTASLGSALRVRVRVRVWVRLRVSPGSEGARRRRRARPPSYWRAAAARCPRPAPACSKAVESAALKAASSSTRGPEPLAGRQSTLTTLQHRPFVLEQHRTWLGLGSGLGLGLGSGLGLGLGLGVGLFLSSTAPSRATRRAAAWLSDSSCASAAPVGSSRLPRLGSGRGRVRIRARQGQWSGSGLGLGSESVSGVRVRVSRAAWRAGCAARRG